MNRQHPPLLSIFILSAAALAYEVLLIRLFSIIHWHHFAFMVISIALLGYGASGSFITVFRRSLLENYGRVLMINIVLFGLSSIACFMAVQRLPFNALEILWDSSQWQRLLFSYVLLTLPFLFVANAIALTMMRFQRQIALVYGIDLLGAGMGALSIMALLQVFSADELLRLLATGGLSAGLFALGQLTRKQRRLGIAVLLIGGAGIYLIPQAWLEVRLSEYKGLQQSLLMKDAALRYTHSSSISRIDVVESPTIPFRNAPGLSLQSPVGPPVQLAVFRDGDEMTTIDQAIAGRALAYHDYMSSALAYHVHAAPRNSLILASASGAQILQAHALGITDIDAVEADRQLSELISKHFADYSGWNSLGRKVTVHNISARGFAASEHRYDIVVMGPSGASAGGAAGVQSLSASYDYTLEALQAYLKQLAPGGLLSLTLWTGNPERENLKLFATAVRALQRSGIEKPAPNIAWIRSWNTATLLLKNTPLSTDEIQRVRDFSETRSFDLAWLPDIQPAEVNRFQLLQEPVFYRAASSLLNPSASNPAETNFIHNYKYNIQPATDDRPYFNHFLKWSSLAELWSLPGRAGISMIEVGYPTLLVTLAQAMLVSFILILLPLLFIKTASVKTGAARTPIIVYFLSIGLAFLFIEIAFIQKFTLILSQPLYAVALALCAFLIFSGLGSLTIQRRLVKASSSSIAMLLRRAVLMIASITIVYIILLPWLTPVLMSWPEGLRILSAFVLTAPLAFAMGMPFALGLAGIQQSMPQLIPWAWGINGCASVLSAILATLLAIEIGFNGVMLCAVVLYLLAWRSGLSLNPGSKQT